MAKTKVLICPYCGDTQPLGERCRSCGGLFEPLSRQASHNEMGPWFIRDVNRPFQPGCSYETLVKLIERGQVTKQTIVRGPTTKQFWTIAKRVPGVSHLLGYCHSCDASVDVGDHGCHACGVPFGAYLDRNYLGLPEVRPLPWEAPDVDEDQRNAPASSRVMDFRRAAEPLGISSFASDEELRGGSAGGGGAYGASHSGGMAMASAAAPAGLSVGPGDALERHVGGSPALHSAARTGVGAVHAGATSIAARAQQQKLLRQKRVIQGLSIGLVILTIVAALSLMRSVTPPVSGQSTSDRAQQPPAASPTNGTDALTVGQPAIDHASAADPAADPDALTINEPPSIDVANLMARADQLIALGAQTDLPLENRIRAYEDAFRILKDIQDHAPSQQRPADLAQRIRAVERSLDDLRLKVFFP